MNASTMIANRGPKACSTCAKAKSRCIPGPNASKCERCHRLNKSCGTQSPAPPRPRKTPRPTRVAELEKRIEDLSSRLESGQPRQEPSPPNSDRPGDIRELLTAAKGRSNGVHPYRHLFPMTSDLDIGRPTYANLDSLTREEAAGGSAASSSSTGSGTTAMSSKYTTPLFGAESQPAPTALATPATSPATSQTQAASATAADSVPTWPEGEEAEAFLDAYSRELAPLFPFVIIPPHMTAAQLRVQKPLFWKAVMMEACHRDGARQVVLGGVLLQEIAMAAITQPKRSLDLLQGLQVLLAWYHYNLNSFQMTNLLFLCRSVCLGLGFTESQAVTKQKEHTSACLEKMRAFAGTYYLVTSIFTTNKKPDALMNTSYLEACCRVLEDKMEYPTDERLVWLVRVQKLAQSISMALTLRNSNVQVVDLPLSIVVKSFKQQLEEFRASLPPHFRDDVSLKSHVSIAEILLYEIGLSESSGLPITEQLEFLWACVAATKGFFATRFAEPFSDTPRFICMTSYDLVYAFLTCLKLISFEAPGWDKNLIRRELAFDQLLLRQAQDMKVMAAQRAMSGHAPNADPLQRLAEKVQCLAETMHLELGPTTETARCNIQTILPGSMVDQVDYALDVDQPMTEVGDATQDIMQDLEVVWGDLTGISAWGNFEVEQFENWTY